LSGIGQSRAEVVADDVLETLRLETTSNRSAGQAVMIGDKYFPSLFHLASDLNLRRHSS
jgi:hypothetical protein